jgi:hypothetical protein
MSLKAPTRKQEHPDRKHEGDPISSVGMKHGGDPTSSAGMHQIYMIQDVSEESALEQHSCSSGYSSNQSNFRAGSG